MIGGLRIFTNDTQQTEDSQSATSSSEDSISDAPSGDLAPSSQDSSDFSNLARESGFLWDRLVPVNDVKSGFDFAYDFKDQYIYWLEHNQSYSSLDIQKVKFDGEERTTLASNDLLDHTSFDAVFSLEFDPSSRNIFLSNMFQSQLEVISVDTKHRALVFGGSQQETGVGRPAAITVNYVNGEIYWVDNGYEAVPIKIG